MAGLQRSTISFRRQGSSGLVWDDKVLSGELDQMEKQKEGGTEPRELRTSRSVREDKRKMDHHSGAIKLDRSKSDGGEGSGGRGHGYRRERPVAPDMDPPSPKVSWCGFCAVKKMTQKDNRVSPGKRKY
ncbi:hypothetical protein NE237_025496 [Protea cynaroides]|uniref:MAPK kinase substrate protein n=1 Tax=Protea cynaroides TaxID=273540 RepID=A0A9Q0K1E1_9MAGN|nr:hypothetical protein NE237_025496 [Protea cynaroides]